MIDGTIRVGDRLAAPSGTVYVVKWHSYWPGITWTGLVSDGGRHRRELRSVLQREWTRAE